jgi:GNAT superfamily N-acetyltransferase
VNSKAVIGYAGESDIQFLANRDQDMSEAVIADQVARREIFVARIGDEIVGWLQMGYFWDHLPFMKVLYLLRPHRGQGIGTALVTFWEQEMRQRGHRSVMTSTLSSETAQHFYRKLGYTDVGGFVLPGKPLELLLVKTLD